jgi:Neuraminidase (sialidase)
MVPRIEILESGRIDERESAFPQAVQLPNGDILCSYSNAGGQHATGGTDWSRSTDGGQTWRVEGTILARTDHPLTTNFLKLSLSPDARTIYAYGDRSYDEPGTRFGDERRHEAVFCASTDGGHTWSAPQMIPMPAGGLEISHGILPLRSGRLLAPAARIKPGRLGEQVVVAISDDGGASWARDAVAMQDPAGKLGYFEQKIAEVAPDRVVATAWTVTMEDIADQSNSYTVSMDGGTTWSAPRFIGTRGQTLTLVPLGGDRAMLLYNRRYGDQGIVMALATITDENWPIRYEGLLYDARARREGRQRGGGLDEMIDFAFGFPTAIRLRDGSYFATNWSVEGGHCGIRWSRLNVDW